MKTAVLLACLVVLPACGSSSSSSGNQADASTPDAQSGGSSIDAPCTITMCDGGPGGCNYGTCTTGDKCTVCVCTMTADGGNAVDCTSGACPGNMPRACEP